MLIFTARWKNEKSTTRCCNCNRAFQPRIKCSPFRISLGHFTQLSLSDGSAKVKRPPEKWKWAAIERSTIRKAEFATLWRRCKSVNYVFAKGWPKNRSRETLQMESHYSHLSGVWCKTASGSDLSPMPPTSGQSLVQKKTFCALNSDVIKSKSWRLKIPPFAMRLAKLQLWTGDWWTCTFRNSLQAVKSRTEQPTELKNL